MARCPDGMRPCGEHTIGFSPSNPGQPAFGRYPRTKVDIPADCVAGEARFPANIVVLGGGGLLLEVSRELVPDTELKIRFQPAQHLKEVEVTARVRYYLPRQGTGVEFTEITDEDRHAILQVIFRRMSYKPRHPRMKFVTEVEHHGGTFLGFSRDLSIGGMFIETRTPLPEGSELKIRFLLDDAGPAIEVEAEVRYAIRDLCMGIEFVDLSPADLKRIEAFVKRAERAK